MNERYQAGFGRMRLFRVALRAGVLLAVAATAKAQSKIGPAAPVTYANKIELYGGLNFMNFQAGQDLPKRMNMGGGEFMGTYWITPKIGIDADFRGEAGTTPVLAQADIYNIHRPLVYMLMGMGGASYRGPKGRYAALDFHALGGMSHGVFDGGTAGVGTPPGSAAQNAVFAGLYTNRTSPIFAAGASIDFNRSKKIAVRLAPDLILEHFGTETREFFAISGGVMYRFGKQ